MRALGTRRTLGAVVLCGAAVAAAVVVYRLLVADDAPVGSYVALTVALAGTAVVLFGTSGNTGSSDG